MSEDFDYICGSFVKRVCYGRDESHGYGHMKKVKENAIIIYSNENINDPYIENLCIVCAWLHDVADHKYDFDGTLSVQVEAFLDKILPQDTKLIMNIINRVSYSKELQDKSDWDRVLGSTGLLVRNIVSDADKLEALGKIGFERCVGYQKEYYHNECGEEIPDKELHRRVHSHANEKLLHIYNNFIHTETGKKLAKPLHAELVTELNKF